MKFNTLFPEMIGLEWGNSALDLGDEEIGRLEDGVAYTRGRSNSNSLSWKAFRQPDGRVRVDIRDNSKSDEDSRSESGSVVLPAVPGNNKKEIT
jgi:hypothetical protein